MCTLQLPICLEPEAFANGEMHRYLFFLCADESRCQSVDSCMHLLALKLCTLELRMTGSPEYLRDTVMWSMV